MAASKYDLARLADIRDRHSTLVASYRVAMQAQRDATTAASRARMDAPPLPGVAPTRAYIAAPGIGNPLMPPTPAPRTNELYFQSLATLQSYTPDEIEKAGISQRVLSQIIVAEMRLSKLKIATVTIAKDVHLSAARIATIELFATEHQL